MLSQTEKFNCYETLRKPEDILKETTYTQIVCQNANIEMENYEMSLTKEEFEEMNALRKAISQNPAYVHPEKQERFTELFVKSLSYVDSPIYDK